MFTGISGENFHLSIQDLSTLYILYIWLHNKADFVMAFVAHVSDKAHGLLVFNVWHFNKDITEHGMGMGKEVWSKPRRISRLQNIY